MRLFIAIQPPEAVCRGLGAAGLELSARLPSASLRPVIQANMHLTLAFLGELDSDRVPILSDLLGRLACRHRGFTLQTAGSGCFSRVVWQGLAPEPALVALQADLVSSLTDAGFSLPREPFLPHISLARSRVPLPAKAKDCIAGLPVSSVQFPAPAVCLMESISGTEGAHYRVLESFQLCPQA